MTEETRLRELKRKWREGALLYKLGIHPNQHAIKKAIESLKGVC